MEKKDRKLMTMYEGDEEVAKLAGIKDSIKDEHHGASASQSQSSRLKDWKSRHSKKSHAKTG